MSLLERSGIAADLTSRQSNFFMASTREGKVKLTFSLTSTIRKKIETSKENVSVDSKETEPVDNRGRGEGRLCGSLMLSNWDPEPWPQSLRGVLWEDTNCAYVHQTRCIIRYGRI